MAPSRALRAALALVVGFAAILVLAANAGAEARAGESAEPLVEGHADAGATVIQASASYESTAGTVVFRLTFVAEPQEGSGAGVEAALFAAPAGCSTLSPPEAVGEQFLLVGDEYEEPTRTEFGEKGILGEIEELGPAAKSISGTSVTYTFSSSKLAGRGFNCAYIVTGDGGGTSLLVFPLKTVVLPPPTPPDSPGGSTTTPSQSQAPGPSPSAPTPAPAALSIGKLKPVALKAGRPRSFTVKVTNTGSASTSRGTLRVKAPKGVVVEPERHPLPVLTPRGSCTVTLRLQLTKAAKPSSTLSLTASASGVTGTGSLVAKLKKG
jgi:NPCBM-associated, NEW3 domain of alpha-galactosidase